MRKDVKKSIFKTRKELQLEKIKNAKENFKLSKKHGSDNYNRLKAYTIDVLTNVHKTTFDCGTLKISLLK